MRKAINGLVAGLAMVLAGANQAGAVPIQWASGGGGNDHWYELVSSQVTWTAADTAANAAMHLGLPGHLATITSAAENVFIRDFVAVNQLAWIGLTDSAVEGTFEWVTGEAVGYTNWNAGEPGNGVEDYVEFIGFFGGDQGEWNDLSNDSGGGRFYIVEYDAVPEPATLALLGLGLAGFAFRWRKAVCQA